MTVGLYSVVVESKRGVLMLESTRTTLLEGAGKSEGKEVEHQKTTGPCGSSSQPQRPDSKSGINNV